MKQINQNLLLFIPSSYLDNEEKVGKARLFVLICFITALFSLYYLLIAWFYNMPHVFLGMASNTFIFPLLPFLLKYNKLPLSWLANLHIGIGSIGVVSSALMTGGLDSSILPCLLLLPMNSFLLLNKQSGFFWTLTSFITILLIGSLAQWGITFHNETQQSIKHFFVASNLIVLGITIFLIALVYENAKTKAYHKLTKQIQRLEEEKKCFEELVSNIIPHNIIPELLQHGLAKPSYFENVSVLVIQFVNFSENSKKLPPETLTHQMDDYIRSFDNIMQHHGLEKINIFGDQYLSVCGLPNPIEHHALSTIQAARDIITFSQTHLKHGGLFNIRIGIHTGPCIAGTLGTYKMNYNVWGESINIATELAENSESDQINISESTYQSLKQPIACHSRGKIKLKGNQEIAMYFVEQ